MRELWLVPLAIHKQRIIELLRFLLVNVFATLGGMTMVLIWFVLNAIILAKIVMAPDQHIARLAINRQKIIEFLPLNLVIVFALMGGIMTILLYFVPVVI